MMKLVKIVLLGFVILHSSVFVLLGFPIFCRAQGLSHLDSTVAAQLGAMLSKEAGGKPFALAADGGLQIFIAAVPHLQSSTTLAQVNALSATVAITDFKKPDTAKATPILLNASGTFLTMGSSLVQRWSIEHSFDILLTPGDRALLETNGDRYVALEQEPASSFWSSIAEPALVVLGGIAIVALFFLIRS